MDRIKRFGVSIPSEVLEQFDKSIQQKGYKTRSEAVCDLMRDHLVEEQWIEKDELVVGTVTIVYDHHSTKLSKTLTTMQHDHHDSIICTTHIHLDEHNCVEVIVVKGAPSEVRTVADSLISCKGVKHGKLVCTTTGENLH